MKGCQCHKALWLNKFQPELKTPISSQQRAIFDRGTNVGKLAEQLFPGGVDARPENPYAYQQSVVDTFQFIEQGHNIIYEAAFQYDQVLAALDILVNKEGKWMAYEVKSSTSISDAILQDAALQYYVITQSGLPLVDFSIVTINTEYVKNGSINVSQLFRIESVITQVLELQPMIVGNILELKTVLKQPSMPIRDIGTYCSSPYPCDFKEYCWKHIPDDSVFELKGNGGSSRAFDLYQQGILLLSDIPADFKLNADQEIQVKNHKTQLPQIDQPALDKFLKQLEFPLYFMDFETFQTAVPEFDGTRPYQQIPFQYSVHRLDTPNAELIHFEWLGISGTDPRIDFLDNLLSVMGNSGSVVVYNASFESSRLKELAIWLPEKAAAIEALQKRIIDLMIPFQRKYYYKPEMKGSFSIKQVLPALVPNMNYDELEIGNGSDASAAYYQLQFQQDRIIVEKTKEALLKYCELDTLAMVRILEKLKKK
jgi:hypothetical protein